MRPRGKWVYNNRSEKPNGDFGLLCAMFSFCDTYGDEAARLNL